MLGIVIQRLIILIILAFSAFVSTKLLASNPTPQDSTPTNEQDQGKILYEQACAACHSRDLGGASGFNLKDGEWIHGNTAPEIIQNIKNGFLSAGMPGFKDTYSQQQIESIVAYLLSKREGFNNLAFKLYQMKDADDRIINDNKLIKSGHLAHNLADFQLPEVQHYIIEFEGDFYTPKNHPTRLWIQWGAKTDITFEVDGEEIERDNRFGAWVPTWPLKLGKQHLKITYHSGHDKPHMKNVPLIVTNDDMSIKLFPASTRAKSIMLGKKLELKATTKPIVQRIKTMKLPAYSIAVGLPQKINFAFNTRQCAVVGLWQGEMLNIGPNIAGRGEDASLPLGDWLFHYPQSLQHKSTPKCQYMGYRLVADNPVFSYQIDGVEYQLSAEANGSNGIHFNYSTSNLTSSVLQLDIPKTHTLTWQSNQGIATGTNLSITANSKGKFTLSATLN